MRHRTVLLLIVALCIGVPLLLHGLLAWANCTSGGPDPGTVVVVGEAPIAMHFTLAAGIDYKFNYPANVALWTTPLRTTPIASGAVFTSGSGAVFGDANGDGAVQPDDLVFIRNRLGTADAASDLDASGLVDENDLVLCRNALGSGPGKVTVYVEGLSASAALCDTSIELLTDPDEDTVFTLAETKGVTAVSVSIGPTIGMLGTPITVTMQPAIAPVAFDANTTAKWTGVYEPAGEPATEAFEIAYSRGEFHESGAGEATLFIGEGSVTNAPPIRSLSASGTLKGSLTIALAGASVRAGVTFILQPNGAKWELLEYPLDDLEWVFGPPMLAGEPAHVQVFEWSDNDPVNPPSEDMLLYLKELHHAAVVRIPETAETVENAPEFLQVDLVSLDASRNEIDRRVGVRLNLLADDGDPDHIVYSTHVVKPVVLLDVSFDPAIYPNVTALQAVDNGYIVAVPGSQ